VNRAAASESEDISVFQNTQKKSRAKTYLHRCGDGHGAAAALQLIANRSK
jgi:hypothetical protein